MARIEQGGSFFNLSEGERALISQQAEDFVNLLIQMIGCSKDASDNEYGSFKQNWLGFVHQHFEAVVSFEQGLMSLNNPLPSWYVDYSLVKLFCIPLERCINDFGLVRNTMLNSFLTESRIDFATNLNSEPLYVVKAISSFRESSKGYQNFELSENIIITWLEELISDLSQGKEVQEEALELAILYFFYKKGIFDDTNDLRIARQRLLEVNHLINNFLALTKKYSKFTGSFEDAFVSVMNKLGIDKLAQSPDEQTDMEGLKKIQARVAKYKLLFS